MDWMSVAHQVRILVIVIVFALIYEFWYESWALAWIFFWIMNDLRDIESDTEKIKGDREQWRDFLIKRKGF